MYARPGKVSVGLSGPYFLANDLQPCFSITGAIQSSYCVRFYSFVYLCKRKRFDSRDLLLGYNTIKQYQTEPECDKLIILRIDDPLVILLRRLPRWRIDRRSAQSMPVQSYFPS